MVAERATISKSFDWISVFNYLLVVAFLMPRGFMEYSSFFKTTGSIAVWIVSALVFILFITKWYDKKEMTISVALFSVYFFLAFFLTFASEKGIVSGLQNLFAVPVLCLYVSMINSHQLRGLIVALVNVLIVCFCLQLLLSRVFILYGELITFLGHCQVISLYGLLGYFGGCAALIMGIIPRERFYMLIILTSLCLLVSPAESSRITLILFLLAYAIYGLFKNAPVFSARLLLIVAIPLTCVLIYITAYTEILFDLIPGIDWTFSGRHVIWAEDIMLFDNSILFGYGLFNSNIIVFFFPLGMDYAHNQILQTLLDGGLLLGIVMFLLFFSIASQIDKVNNKSLRVVILITYVGILAYSVFDAFSIYCHTFFLIALMSRIALEYSQAESEHLHLTKFCLNGEGFYTKF